MNIQAILDETAKIAGGGPMSGDPVGLYRGAGAITAGGKSVAHAWSIDPGQELLSHDGLVHISRWDAADVDHAASDLPYYRHRIEMQLMLSPGRSDARRTREILMPFVPAYVAAFNAKVKLGGGIPSLAEALLVGVNGSPDAWYPDRVAIEFLLIATEKEATAYAA